MLSVVDRTGRPVRALDAAEMEAMLAAFARPGATALARTRGADIVNDARLPTTATTTTPVKTSAPVRPKSASPASHSSSRTGSSPKWSRYQATDARASETFST